MTTRVPLPTGSYTTQDPQASCKRLVGAFSEIMAQTSPLDTKNQIPPIAVRRMPGITEFADIQNSATPTQSDFQSLTYTDHAGHVVTLNASAATFQAVGNKGIWTFHNPPTSTNGNLISTGVTDVSVLWGDGSSYAFEIQNGTDPTDAGGSGNTLNGFAAEAIPVTNPPVPIITIPFGVLNSSNLPETVLGFYTFYFSAGGGGTYLTFILENTTPVGTASLPVRGFTTMNGVTYVVIGPTLYVLASDGSLAPIGTGILGSGFVRMLNNGACLVVLIPNSQLAWTFALSGGFAQLTDPGFTQYGAIDMVFCDTFIVFLAQNGKTLFTDDGQQASGQGQITFDTGSAFAREFGTDLFVGLCVDHREVMGMGALTSEGYLNAGNAVGSPLGSAPNSFMEIGAHPDTAYCIAKQDQAYMWIANDLTVRRRNDQTPTRISNSGIEQILSEAGPVGGLVGSYALTPTVNGHPLWAAVLPALQRTLVYDCLTTEWFELESYATGNWRPLCYWNAFGKQLVGDSVSSQIGYLDSTAFTEFGDQIVTQITTQAVFDDDNRITHDRLELVITCGGGTVAQTDTFVTLYVSDDNGSTWYARETVSFGLQGQRTFRCYWTKLGQSRRRVYRFQFTSPTVSYSVAVIAELDGGRW